MSEIFFVCDIETNGPLPGVNCMKSLSFAPCWDPKGNLQFEDLPTFYVVLKDLPGCYPNPETMEWWKDFPEQWAELNDPAKMEDPEWAMSNMLDYVLRLTENLKHDAVFTASPVGYDFRFVCWYDIYFNRKRLLELKQTDSIFSHRGFDVRSYLKCLLGRSFFNSGTSSIPKAWQAKELPHTHRSIDDAIKLREQIKPILIAGAEMKKQAAAWNNAQPAVETLKKIWSMTKTQFDLAK